MSLNIKAKSDLLYYSTYIALRYVEVILLVVSGVYLTQTLFKFSSHQEKTAYTQDIKKPSMPTKGGDSAWRVGNLIFRGHL